MDIVLNPLGVPSRMNVGQLQTQLGWVCEKKPVCRNAFLMVFQKRIREMMDEADLPESGKTVLLTAAPAIRRHKVTVGVICQ